MAFGPLLSGEYLDGPPSSSGFGVLISGELIDASPASGFSSLIQSEDLELQIVVPNHGPRPKQISTINNDGLPAFEGQMLGVVTKPDWIDVYVEDLVVPSRADGRLTTGDGDMIPDPSDVLGTSFKGAVHYVPHIGDQIALWDGSSWGYHTIPPFSEGGVPGVVFGVNARDGSPITTSENYDVYIYDSAGTLALEFVRWNNHSAGFSSRAVASQQSAINGVIVLAADPTRRYVGTIRTASTIAFAGNTFQHRGIWNWNNRILIRGARADSTGANVSSAFATAIPWGGVGSPDTDYPIHIVTGHDWTVRAYFALIPRAFVQTGVTVSNDEWRCHNTVYLNQNSGGFPAAQSRSIGVTSHTRKGLSVIGTQRISTMFLPTVWAGTIQKGYNYLQPMWAAEQIVQCSGCSPGDVATAIWGQHAVVELEQ